MEEDLPFDANPFPHRMGVIGKILAMKFDVTRYASQFNHKLGTPRSMSENLRVVDNQKIILLRSLFNSRTSKLLRFINFYVSAIQLFLAFLRANEKPSLIICAMPTPVMCFACALYKVIFSRKTKLVLDVRDLWPEIILDEMQYSISASILHFAMRGELKFAQRFADGFLGITDFFSKHLQQPHMLFKPSQTFYLVPGSKMVCAQGSDSRWRSKYKFTHQYKTKIVFGGTISKTTFKELSQFIDVIGNVPDAVLIVCGDGYFYEHLCQKVVASNVRIMGNLSYDEFGYVKSISDYGLICVENRIDYRNSLSNKFFDYIHSGLPIISNAGGLVASVVESYEIGYVYRSSEHLFHLASGPNISHDTVVKKLKANVHACTKGDFSAELNASNLIGFVDNLLASS